MEVSGIYKIESKIHPERVYIGSAINIKDRRRIHLLGLNHNKHHNSKLQSHVNKYGIEDLVFSVVLFGCKKEELVGIEQYFIDSFKPWFNIAKIAGSSLGIKRSEETRHKLHLLHINKKKAPFSDEHKHNIGKAKIGNTYGLGNHHIMSEESKQKMRKPKSKEARENMSKAHTGVKLGAEHIRRREEGRLRSKTKKQV